MHGLDALYEDASALAVRTDNGPEFTSRAFMG
jgi:hypothetical protein